MSSSYSANQYDNAFRSKRLQNWCQAKSSKERPAARDGTTRFIADDRGHLMPGLAKKGSAWPDFKGTWDLPTRIPAHSINPTGRSAEGLSRLRTWGIDPQRGRGNSDKPWNSGKQLDTAEASRLSPNRPVSQGGRTDCQDLDPQAAESVAHSADDKQQASQDAGNERPKSQCSAAGEEAASAGAQ